MSFVWSMIPKLKPFPIDLMVCQLAQLLYPQSLMLLSQRRYQVIQVLGLIITVIKEEWRTEFEENKKRLEINTFAKIG